MTIIGARTKGPAIMLSRRQVVAGASALAISSAVDPLAASPALDQNSWLDRFGPGVHKLAHVPAFADYKLKKIDARFPDDTYAQAVKTAWGRTGPSLAAWCGGAFHFPYFYTCSGGHADSGLDSIYRVDIVTGQVDVTRPSPLVRPHRTSRGTVNLPERDDYLQGHTYSSMLALDRDRLWIGHYPLFSWKVEYFDRELPVAWEVNFADQDEMRYPARKILPHRFRSGPYLELPNGTIFVGENDRYGIAGRDGLLLYENKTRFGWTGCYSKARNEVYAIEYKGEITAVALDDRYKPKSKRWLVDRGAKAPWIYGAGIANFGDKLLIFTGGESYYLLDPPTGLFKPYPNPLFRERIESRCFNRFITLRDGAYLYIPTDQKAQPLLWVLKDER